MATCFHVLGIEQDLPYVHPSGWPISMINQDGQPIKELLGNHGHSAGSFSSSLTNSQAWTAIFSPRITQCKGPLFALVRISAQSDGSCDRRGRGYETCGRALARQNRCLQKVFG